MDLQTAEKATRNGAIAGFVSAAITSAAVVTSNFFGFWGQSEASSDPKNLVDSALVAGLAFGVLRKSRSAALLLFLYFLFGRIHMFVETGRIVGAGIGFLFLYYFGYALKGTFVYHRIRRDEDPVYRPTKRWHLIVWPLPVFLVLVGALLGLSSRLPLAPPMGVVRGEEVRAEQLALFSSEGVLEPEETVVLFYSYGFFSIREGGSILTDRRVISYEEADGRFAIEAASYREIRKVAVMKADGMPGPTVIVVDLHDGGFFHLLISPEEDGDLLMVDELSDRWQAANR